MNQNTGGPASEKTLLDEFAGQALAGLCANPGGPIQANGSPGLGFTNCDHLYVVGLSYDLAYAMLAEKARREAAVKELSTTDHSHDAGKMAELENVKKDLAQALDEGVWLQAAADDLRRLAADVLPADIKEASNDESLRWCAEQVRARVNTLEALNRELVWALDTMMSGWVDPYDDNDNVAKARAILAKAKEVA